MLLWREKKAIHGRCEIRTSTRRYERYLSLKFGTAILFVTHMYIFLHVPCLSTVLPDEREFQHAAKMNNLETMEKLFKKNLNINAVDTVSTACQKCDACGVAWRKPSVLLLNVSPSWMCLSSVPHVQDVLKSFTQHNPQVFF